MHRDREREGCRQDKNRTQNPCPLGIGVVAAVVVVRPVSIGSLLRSLEPEKHTFFIARNATKAKVYARIISAAAEAAAHSVEREGDRSRTLLCLSDQNKIKSQGKAKRNERTSSSVARARAGHSSAICAVPYANFAEHLMYSFASERTSERGSSPGPCASSSPSPSTPAASIFSLLVRSRRPKALGHH